MQEDENKLDALQSTCNKYTPRIVSPPSSQASDLSRAATTAEFIGSALNLPVERTERLREENYGLLEGHTADEIQADPNLAAILRHRKHHQSAHDDDGSETREVSLQRAADVLLSLDVRFGAHEHVIVVTHGGFIINCFRHVNGFAAGHPVVKEKKCPKIPNTSVSIVESQRASFSGLLWGLVPPLRYTPSAS